MPRYKIVNTIFLVGIILLILLDWKLNISWTVYAGISLIFVLVQIYGTLYMSAGFFLPAVCSGREGSGSIAITFDDGPVPGSTEKVMEILTHHNLEACFFCIGERVHSNPMLVKHLHDNGHIIGNHSYYHRWNFDLLSSKKMEEELARTDAAIADVLQKKPNFFRPPYGVTNPNLAVAVGGDYHAIGWSIRSFDTTIKDRTKLLKRVTRNLKDGDIVLFHDHSDAMIQILPDFIKHVEAIGLKIVRLDKLIGESPYKTAA